MASLLRTTPFLLGVALTAAGPRTAAAAADAGEATHPVVATTAQPGVVALAPRLPALPERTSADRLPPPPPRGLFRPGGLALPAAESLATNLGVLGWNRSIGGAPWADITADSIGRNLRSGWVLDDDQFWVNQFGHPYQGTWSFTAARSSGLGFWESAPFTFGASALWEIACETTAPSLNDQVTTTVSGMVFGEILYRFAGALRSSRGAWRGVLASVLAPMGEVNRRLLGTSQAVAAPPSRWQFLAGAAGTPAASGIRQPIGYGALSLTYGVPGSAGLEIERPFDHFTFDLGWTAAADPAATVLARGLVAGSTFDASVARGVYGAYLSFDLDTPREHRVSTSAVRFGGSASADLGAGVALEGDAIASAVLLGAGGTVDRGPDGLGRDYRFGPGQQAVLALRMLGPRASAGVSVRQYLLFAADGERGTEQLLHGTANAQVRIAGGNGVGVEVSRYLRRADVGGETVRQSDSVVRLYVVLLGGA